MLTSSDVCFGILGQGRSGKTTLAKQLAAGFRQGGVGVLALTLPHDTWEPASWQTSDPERFVAMFNRAERCACFMEFSDAGVGKFAKPFEDMFTKGRHRGHRMFAIAQRHTQISPLIRDQWDAFWLFSCGKKTAETLAEEFGDDAILEAVTYPRYQYLFKRRVIPIQRSSRTSAAN
jgi:hypothetical protein